MNVLICLAALAFVQDAGHGPPDFVMLAEVETSALEDSVRAWPDEAREAVRLLVVRLAGETGRGRTVTLRAAERIAGALATTLLDSLQWHRVQFAASLDSLELSYLARADSLRLAGNNALFADGVATALDAWRRGYRLFESIGDSTGMTSVLGNIGAGFYVDDQRDSAVGYLEQAIQLARTIGHLVAEGNANVILGNLAKRRGDLQQATVRYGQAIRIHSRIGSQSGLAADYNNLGLVARALGGLDRARQSFEAAFAINVTHGWDGGAGDNLINLGNLDLVLSDFESARRNYRDAVERYAAAGQPFNVADALYNIGELLIRVADYRAARDVMIEALNVYREVDAPDGEVLVHLALATVHSAMGDIQRASDALREAESALQRAGIDDSALQGAIELARGDLALTYNRLGVASTAYERSARQFAREQDAFGVAQTLEGRGILAILRDEPAEASRFFTRAQSVFEEAGDVRSSSWAGLQSAGAALAAGDTALARARFELSASGAMRTHDATAEAQAHLGLGEVALEQGLVLTAQVYFEQAIELVGDEVPAVEWEMRAKLAETLAELGQTDAAAAEYLRAIELVESMAASVRTDDRRAAFLSDKWHVYRQLAELELNRGNTEEAFAVSERLRARRTLELLANATIPWRDGSETTAREQLLRQRITDLTRQLQGSNGEYSVRGPDITRVSLVSVREALIRAQGEYANLLSDLRDASPAYASVVAGSLSSLSDVQQALQPREVMLEYLLHDGSITIFGLTADTVVAVSAPVDRLALTGLVDFARNQIIVPESPEDDGLWRAALTRLHEQLIRPAERVGILAGRDRLILVPYGELHYLPFDALIDGESGRYLVEDYEIALAPSATVWLELRERSSGHTDLRRVLALAPLVDVMPGTRAEVQAIAERFGSRATVVIGRAATESFLEREGSAYDVVHLATYGVLNKHNPLFSYMEFSDADGNDGRLEVHEVFSLNLNASLVVLSACQTGLGSGALADVPEGDDWVGLVRAFLAAGASGTVATLWPVEDQRSADLMDLFYENLLASGDPVAALTASKRAAIGDDELSHPYAWAGYTITGGWQ